jgi:hypothetical protein
LIGKKSKLKYLFLIFKIYYFFKYSDGLIAMSSKLIYFSEKYQNQNNDNSTNNQVLSDIVSNLKKGCFNTVKNVDGK